MAERWERGGSARTMIPSSWRVDCSVREGRSGRARLSSRTWELREIGLSRCGGQRGRFADRLGGWALSLAYNQHRARVDFELSAPRLGPSSARQAHRAELPHD